MCWLDCSHDKRTCPCSPEGVSGCKCFIIKYILEICSTVVRLEADNFNMGGPLRDGVPEHCEKDMRINDPNLTARLQSSASTNGLAPTASKKSAAASSVDQTGETSRGSSARQGGDANGDNDNVSLSNLSARLSELGSSSSAWRSLQVDELSSLYARGSYAANAAATSQAIVRDAGLSGI